MLDPAEATKALLVYGRGGNGRVGSAEQAERQYKGEGSEQTAASEYSIHAGDLGIEKRPMSALEVAEAAAL
ncbi:hypothetical protein [Roseateles sp.]|uniref:hypothetical protein n=1 Tax=Roseateles sp. TaxID=1971397 RepID=UPI003BA4D766